MSSKSNHERISTLILAGYIMLGANAQEKILITPDVELTKSSEEGGIQVKAKPESLTITGTSQGGTVTIGIYMLLDNQREVTIQTQPGQSNAEIASALATKAKFAQAIGNKINFQVPDGHVYFKSNDPGILSYPSVKNLNGVLDKAANQAVISWENHEGIVYDKIYLRKNFEDAIELSSTATNFIDGAVRKSGDPEFNALILQYVMIGVKDGVISDLAKIIMLRPVSIVKDTPAVAKLGQPYQFYTSIKGGVVPITIALDTANSKFPPGLNLNPSTGVISGVPTESGSFFFFLNATDSSSPPFTASRGFTIKVEP